MEKSSAKTAETLENKSAYTVKKSNTRRLKNPLFNTIFIYFVDGKGMRDKLIIKMMKYGVPRMGAIRVVNQLNEDQILAAYTNTEYLQSVIDVIYYKKGR